MYESLQHHAAEALRRVFEASKFGIYDRAD